MTRRRRYKALKRALALAALAGVFWRFWGQRVGAGGQSWPGLEEDVVVGAQEYIEAYMYGEPGHGTTSHAHPLHPSVWDGE